MLQADKVTDAYFDGNGAVLPFEAKERPWYVGAVKNKDVYFTGVFTDSASKQLGVACSVPVYEDNQLKGVAGAGMLLTNLASTLEEAKLCVDGEAFIMDTAGNLVASTAKEGELAADNVELVNLFENGNQQLNDTLQKFIENSNEMVFLVEINGEQQYISCAKMNAINWIFVSVLPEEEITMPVIELENTLNTQNTLMGKSIFASMSASGTILFVLILVIVPWLVFNAEIQSKKMVKPIKALTNKVRNLKGENLEFTFESTGYEETDIFASAFQDLTERIQAYIRNITEITAEKERLGLGAREDPFPRADGELRHLPRAEQAQAHVPAPGDLPQG